MGVRKYILAAYLFILFCQIAYAATLLPYLIDPLLGINVTQNEFFNFTIGIKCGGGDCGNVTATLDPKAEFCGKNPCCRTAESPCIAGSELLMSRDNLNGASEPNANNTIDNCGDGYYLTYGRDESLENITITSLSGSSFKAGGAVQVDIWVYYNYRNGINIIYSNNTNLPDWKVKAFIHYRDLTNIPAGFYQFSRNITLDGMVGNHTIRGSLLWFGDETTTCGTLIRDDNDDVTFYVFGPKGIIPMHSGTPFYTITQNPIFPNNRTCLQDMKDGKECNITWTVNATGNIGERYEFFAIFESDNPDVNKTETERVNIEIVEKQQEEPKENLTNYNISLIQGWNLISFPLNLTNKSINYIFNNINFRSIFSYGSWFYYFNETDNNFNTINETNGYWVNSLNEQTLTIEGNEFDSMNLSLKQGWNLIGYPSLNSTLINETLKDVNYSIVYWYNNSDWLSYVRGRNDSLNTLKYFVPGYGYWVNSLENVSFGVS